MSNEQVKSEVVHNLINSFDYAFKGEQRAAKFITLKAPTTSNISCFGSLKQGFIRALNHGSEKQEKNKNIQQDSTVDVDSDDVLEGFTGPMLMATILASPIDYAGYLESAKFLFTESHISLIDGEMEFNKELTKKLSFDDLEVMTGEYIKLFILPSVLGMMQK